MSTILLIGLALWLPVMVYALLGLKDEGHAWRRLKRRRVTAIGDARPGSVVKVVGRLGLVGEAARAPFTGRVCVGYRAVFVAERDGGKASQVEEYGDLLVVDGEAKALVKMDGAVAVRILLSRARTGTFDAPPPELAAFFARHGQGSSYARDGGQKLHWVEETLEEGDDVAVFGLAEAVPPLEGSAAPRLTLRSPKGAKARITNDPKLIG
ncbi:MAG: hypothetical protein EXR72_25080 [Myxococcales bacterium]|nr:hypothetical protein [Myxococcales bacterium]